jgi:hypothetical protein
MALWSQWMSFIKVKWSHNHSDEPTLLYSELDEHRKEVRKVEVFPDRSMGFAGRNISRPDPKTWLGNESIPNVEQIASDPQFEPAEICREEFELLYLSAQLY